MIVEIVSMINLIAIVILFILFFTKNNKENFTGVPPSYTNLLVSDSDGNLDTFSLTTLENDIDTKIREALTLYTNTEDLQANYQPVGDYALKTDLDNYLKLGTEYYQKINNIPPNDDPNYKYVGWENDGQTRQKNMWRQQMNGRGGSGPMKFEFEVANVPARPWSFFNNFFHN
jgi:hypothetical protein